MWGPQSSIKTKKTKTRGNGQGSAYKRGKTWVAHQHYNGTTRTIRRKGGFRTKSDALDYLNILSGVTGRQKRVTLADLHKIWEEKQAPKFSKSKITHYRTAWRRLELLHERDITGINLDDMQDIVDNAPGEYYPKRDMKVLLSQLYQIALKREQIDRNRAEFIDLPDCPKSKKDGFNKEERAAIWKDYEAGHAFTGYVLIMIYTGMRVGELYKIQKSNVFLDRQYMIGGIKSDAGIDRVIPIADKILPIVQEKYNNCVDGLIEMRQEDFYDQYAEMIDRTKIRGLNPHCCRHTCATVLAEENVPDVIMKEILGHANYSTTLDYIHISIDKKIEAINKI